uniref:Uncharacterized protein n=1 Tax=Chrysemys picta bellii TaxID=8478 RepID=A0A8C3HFS2_CHRPI
SEGGVCSGEERGGKSFKSISNLTVFKIQNNKITGLFPEYFPLALTECDISKNKFKMLSLNETLKKVESLNLSGNLITQIDPTSPIILLTSLDISQNLVSEISDRLGKFLPILKYFNLSRNKISFLQSRLNISDGQGDSDYLILGQRHGEIPADIRDQHHIVTRTKKACRRHQINSLILHAFCFLTSSLPDHE